MAITQYRGAIKLQRDRYLSEFLTKTGQPTAALFKAQQNFGLAPCGRVDVTLTPAQIAALGTPIPLLPAVAGQTYVIEGPIFWRFTYNAPVYTGAGTTVIQYHTGAIAATFTLPASVITAAASSEQIMCALPATGTNVVPTIGDSLEITGPSFGGGGQGTLRLTFTYLMF